MWMHKQLLLLSMNVSQILLTDSISKFYLCWIIKSNCPSYQPGLTAGKGAVVEKYQHLDEENPESSVLLQLYQDYSWTKFCVRQSIFAVKKNDTSIITGAIIQQDIRQRTYHHIYGLTSASQGKLHRRS